jgi:hypothetical protein
MSNNTPTLAFNLERDLRVLSAMASSLTPYLYEDEMFGYLAGDLPKLTLGGLLLRLYRLSRLDDVLDADQQTLVQDARINFEAECSKWAAHYEKKLQHELLSRLKAFDYYLEECLEDPRSAAAGYPIQAEKRTMIEHLRAEAEEHAVISDEIENRLRLSDQRLRRLFRDGEFISDERLKQVYPREHFWWLYGHIAENGE